VPNELALCICTRGIWAIYILKLTLGSLIAKLSDKTTAQFETVITPSESQFFLLKHDGFQNIIYFETFFTKKLNVILLLFVSFYNAHNS